MKTPKLLLSIITLLVIVSCSTQEESVVPEEVAPEEQDQFFITITENAQTLSIKASSYTEYQQYKLIEQTAFQNGEEIGKYYPAIIDGATLYGIENISVQRASSSMSMWSNHGEVEVANFTIDIESSNEKDVMYDQEDITRELFQMQNNVYHPVDLGEQEGGLNLIKENFDLAQINISYSFKDHTYKSFRYYKSCCDSADAFKQPAESFFNVISVTEKQHRAEDSSFSTYNYDYVIEGNGKVRVFNEHDPENDYKDLEFTFKIPSRKLVPIAL
jgi:hypothetical protein